MISCAVLLAGTLSYYGANEASAPADFAFVNQGQAYTLDPQQMSWSSDHRICFNVWEGLTTFDAATLEPIAGMAHFPPEISADELSYTFHLRSDSAWCNGDRVTAGDFVRGWRRALEPGTASDYAFLLLDHVAGTRDYYDWRNRAVELLGKMKSLAEGREISASAAETLLREVRAAGFLPPDQAAPHSPANLEPDDWGKLREAFLKDHASRRDGEWSKVGVQARDQHTLRVTLIRPTAYFLELTSQSVLMPIHHSIELLGEYDQSLGMDHDGLVTFDTQWTKPNYHRNGYPGLISNGIYRITDWQFRRKLRLAVNPHHYDAESADLKTIDIMMYENANTAFQAYETGVVDWISVLSVEYVGELLRKRKTGERPDIKLTPAFGTYYYNFNCIDDELPDGRRNPFVDVRVRRAFSISIDRDKFCASVADKENPPMSTLIPTGSIRGYPAVTGHPRDVELANRLLDQAGYRDRATFPEVTILYNTGFDHERKAEAIANMWQQALGVRVRLQGKETKTLRDDKIKHNFQIVRGGWYGDYFDPTTFLDTFTAGNGNNYSGYAGARFEELMQEARDCREPRRRMEILARAETLLVTEEFPFVSIFRYTNPQAHRSYVTGIHPNPREIYHWRHIKVEK